MGTSEGYGNGDQQAKVKSGSETTDAHERRFDEGWREIAGNFGRDPTEIEAARLKLANALLSVAAEDSRDVEALKMGALEAMTLEYRQRQRIAG